ncbi:MAG: WD40 repeat domain-containing protein, partial [Streptosporangiaceae bacterium]
GRIFLASGGLDQYAVSIRDPESGALHSVLRGIDGGVNSICAFAFDGQTMLAAGSDDRTVSLWNPASGTQFSTLQGHEGSVEAVCSLTLHGRTLLASGGYDHTVRIWDPATGNQSGVLEGHADTVTAVCAFASGGTTLVCSGSGDKTIRVWDLDAGTQIAILEGHDGGVNSACAVALDGQTLLATASDDETVRLWEPTSGTQTHILRGHTRSVTAMCTFTVGGRVLLATGGVDGAIRTWNPGAGAPKDVNADGHVNPVYAMTPFALGKRKFYAVAGDKVVTILDAKTGASRHTLHGHTDKVNAVCSLTLGGRIAIASGGDDEGIRIWDPANGGLKRILKLQGNDETFNYEINDIVPIRLGGKTRLAACGDIDAGLWNPLPRPWTFRGIYEDEDFDDFVEGEGTERIMIGGRIALRKLGWRGSTLYEELADVHGGEAICEFQENGRPLLAVGGAYPGTISIWDPAAGTQLRTLGGHDAPVTAICPFISQDSLFLTSSSEDHTVRVWDPVTGDQLRVLAGHNAPVTGVCAFSVGKRALLATSSEDRTVRVWDPAGGVSLLAIPTREESLSIACDDGLLAVGMTDGMLVLRLDPGFLGQVAR